MPARSKKHTTKRADRPLDSRIADAEALRKRGVAFIEKGSFAEAEESFRAALKLRPQAFDTHHDLAVALARQGKLEEAITCFLEAHRLKPEGADAVGNLALAYVQAGKKAESLPYYRKLIQLRPGPDSHLNLANALRGTGLLEEAVASYQEAVRLNPESADLHHSLGLALSEQGKKAEAMACYRQALRLKPLFAEANNNLGVLLEEEGKLDEAIACFHESLRLNPKSPETHSNYGVALAEQGKTEEAISAYEESLRLDPNSAQAHNNIGNALRGVGRVDEAVAHHRRAIELRAEYAEAYNNLGIDYVHHSDQPQALECYDVALRLKPEYSEARLNRSLAWLTCGDFEKGWREYEWRWRVKPLAPRPFPVPRWDGTPLGGRRILLYAEQGLGDSLQFIRYARLVKQRGGKVLFECPRALLPLLGRCLDVDQLVPQGDALPPFDVQAPLLSVPGILGSGSSALPADVPYLLPRPDLVQRWRDELRREPGLKIGIAWQGSPKYKGDRQRSVPLRFFAPLAQVPGVRLLSLQKGFGTEQIAGVGFSVAQLGEGVDEASGAFMDTAAVMANLDLMITSDTALPHLAGALGVPVWVALPFAADWRWLLDRADSPWYPSMRLFRQKQRGDWAEVFARIAHSLTDWTRERPSPRVVAIQNVPTPDADEHLRQGSGFFESGNLDAAVQAFEKALALRSDWPEARHNLAATLARLGKLDEAIEQFCQTLRLQPDSADAQGNLGLAYLHNGELDNAVRHLEASIRLRPGVAETFNNLGVTRIQQNRPGDAAGCYRQALSLRPEYAEAHNNLGRALLVQGDYVAGWPEYEWRWKCPNSHARAFREPRWDGTPLNGRPILLHAEQGLGDTLQFVRFAQDVQLRGGRVILEVPSLLLPILGRCPAIDRLIPQGETLPPFDVQIPLLSLPLALGSWSHAGDRTPYLAADKALVERWKEKLGSVPGGFKVGIAWQGNPRFTGDRQRSVPLKHFEAIGRLSGVRLVSLQKRDGLDQLKNLGGTFEVTTLGAGVDEASGAFMDTAAVMKNMDLVVTSDTALAHLAGALGVPVWVALPFAPDWRWLLDREDCPWYPTMRLFRQKVRGDWDEVFARIADAIGRLSPLVGAASRASTVAAVPKEYHQGIELLKNGKKEAAAASLRHAVDQSPDSFEVNHNLGVALAQQGKIAEAIGSLRKALQIKPDSPDALGNLGLALQQQGQAEEAVGCFQQSLRFRPDCAETHNNLGVALRSLDREDEAVACYRSALQRKPDYAEAHNNLGDLLRQRGDLDEALFHCREAVRLRPDLAEAHNNLGIAIWGQRKFKEAFASYQESLRLKPAYAEARLNRSLAWLTCGDFEKGWREYEWRWRVKPLAPRTFSAPRWDGTPLGGRRILLYAEQGLGDSLQFIRYARLIKQRGGKVLFECPRALLPLLGRCPDVDQLVPQGDPLPPFDVQAPLLSVPGIMGTTSEAVPAEVPYIVPRPDLVQRWREQLRREPGLKIGIAWQGSPKYKGDRQRSVPLRYFAPLAQVPGVRLVSLQKGFGTEQIAGAGFPVTQLGEGVDEASGAFMDTAAVMANVDLMITSDTALPHLAGALGVPVWVALPFAADWRWLLDREDSPWYPSMRLFRQRERGDWAEVFARIAQCLNDWTRGRGSPTAERSEGANRAYQQAMDLIKEQKLPEAEVQFREAIRLGHGTGETYHNLGVALAQQRKYSDAIDSFQKSLHENPDSPDAHGNLGLAYLHFNQPEEAIKSLRRSLELRPQSAETHNNLGVALMRQKQYVDAIGTFDQALKIRPDFTDALCNKGNALRLDKKLPEAIDCYDQALQLNPDAVEVHSNRGIALSHLGRLDEAVDSYRKALALEPNHADACNNLGVLLADMNRLDESLGCFDAAVAAKPDHAETHRNRAIVRLLAGDYDGGWPEYQWRWQCENVRRWPFEQPLWDGSPLAGRRILLHFEQGLGDTLQFVRYAMQVKQGGGMVIVCCQRSLTQLLEQSPGIDQLVPEGERLPPFDVHAPFMDLPAILKTRLENIPAEVPYVFADEDRVRSWKRRLAAISGFKVGIAWQGSKTYGGDASRSIALKNFAPLADVEGVRLIGLQKGFGTEQIATAQVPLIDLDRQLDENSGAFVDTAAVMKNLDLVITSDTSIPHLAGALGVPVWVALSVPSDWRFLRGRQDCPWYPTMRLFRQTRRGDWTDVFAAMAEELRRRVGASPIAVPVAPGELIDKLTILSIKQERVTDADKLQNVRHEYAVLAAARDQAIASSADVLRLTAELQAVNENLWQIEDDVRECEHRSDFGERFVALARSVYQQNDRRAAIKRQINVLLGSRLVEEKSYRAETGLPS